MSLILMPLLARISRSWERTVGVTITTRGYRDPTSVKHWCNTSVPGR